MNHADRLKSEGVLPASTIGHPAEDEASSTRDYLRVESCPCCGSPAAKAKCHIASSPPAETLSPERHGKFLSGYSSGRVFFTYFKCLDCSALFCPTYYRQSQLDG